MDTKDDSTIISRLLGTSNACHQTNNKGPTIGRPEEHNVDQTNTEKPYCDTSNELESQNTSANRNNFNLNEQEKPKLHRLGSNIDWGASAFDFSNVSRGTDVIANQRTYTEDNNKTSSMKTGGSFQKIVPTPTTKNSNSSQKDITVSVPDSTDQTNFLISQKSTIDKFDNFIPKVDENFTTKRYLNESLHNAAPCENNETSIPIVVPRRLLKTQQSILDTVEEGKIMAAPQTVLSDDILSTSFPSNTSIPDNGTGEKLDHSALEGIMSSWFFKNKSLDEDNLVGAIQREPGMSMEGIGGGVLTSKVVSALNLQKTPQSTITSSTYNSSF